MTMMNTKGNSTFSERLCNGKIKCYKVPNHGEKFYDYREKVSVIHFRKYLYSLRYVFDFKWSGGEYLGY